MAGRDGSAERLRAGCGCAGFGFRPEGEFSRELVGGGDLGLKEGARAGGS